MSRRIIIDKYEGNTVYSVHVIDSFGQEHMLGYSEDLTGKWSTEMIELKAKNIWSIEEKKEVSSMNKAIKEMIEIDKQAGITSVNRDGLD